MRVSLVAVGRMKSGPEAALVQDYVQRFDRTGRALGLGPLTLREVEARKGGGMAAEAEQRNDGVEVRQRLLQGCLEKLNERHRDLIRARYQDGSTLAQLADAFGKNANAIKQTLFRARATLVDCVRAKMSEASA